MHLFGGWPNHRPKFAGQREFHLECYFHFPIAKFIQINYLSNFMIYLNNQWRIRSIRALGHSFLVRHKFPSLPLGGWIQSICNPSWNISSNLILIKCKKWIHKHFHAKIGLCRIEYFASFPVGHHQCSIAICPTNFQLSIQHIANSISHPCSQFINSIRMEIFNLSNFIF